MCSIPSSSNFQQSIVSYNEMLRLVVNGRRLEPKYDLSVVVGRSNPRHVNKPVRIAYHAKDM